MTSTAVSSRHQFVVDYTRGAALVALLIVLPVAQITTPRISTGFVAFCLMLCGICWFAAPRDTDPKVLPGPPDRARYWLNIALFSLAAWSLISLSWGLDAKRGAINILAFGAGIFTIWFLGREFSRLDHARLVAVFLAGLILSIAMLPLGLDYMGVINDLFTKNYSLFDLNRNAIALCLLIWPAILLIKKGLVFAISFVFLFAAAAFVIFQTESETAKLGLPAGACAALLVWLWGGFRKIIALGMAVTALAMPLAATILDWVHPYVQSNFAKAGHFDHRLKLWQGFSEVIWEKFLFGWGMKSDRILGSSEAVTHYATKSGYPATTTSPHNAILELWVNIGLVGMVPVVAILTLAGWIRFRHRHNGVAFTALTVSAFLMSLTGSSGFQGWLLAACAIAGALFHTLLLQERNQSERT